MIEKKADLHVHTIFSDGSFTPREVIARAKETGLSAIAITDHDNTNALPIAKKIGDKEGIEVVSGIEMTADYNGIEVHVLGYFIDYENETFQKKLSESKKYRIKKLHIMIECLRKFNINIDPKEVIGSTHEQGSISRLHLANAMHKNGYIANAREAFRKYIGNNKPCYVNEQFFNTKQAIDLIKSVGGVPVLAHPYIIKSDDIISDIINQGICGIEVYHSDHYPSQTEHYLEIAKKFHLVITGGSDCHGHNKEKVLMGNIKVDYKAVEELSKEAEKIRKDFQNEQNI